jgi:replicative DNA helicase
MNAGAWMTADELFESWRNDLVDGRAPVLWPWGDGPLNTVEIGPGLVVLFGGPPGAGKTMFATQQATDALRLNDDLRVVIANVEVSPRVLLDRQLSRLSGVEYERVRKRQFDDEDRSRIATGVEAIRDIADRLVFVTPPFDIDTITAAADEHDAGLIVLDYVQRIRPLCGGSDRRKAMDDLMGDLRLLADAGVGVVAVSSVGRQRDDKGRSTYAADSLGLASYRESSELEFGADSAYMLGHPDAHGHVTLRHLKARHSERIDVALK